MTEITTTFVNDVYNDNLSAAMDAIKGVLAARAVARIERARPEVAATIFTQPDAEPEEEEFDDDEDA